MELQLNDTVLITGAAGNLGSMLARHLMERCRRLRLMVHRTPLSGDLENGEGIEVVRADLGRPDSLTSAVSGVDVVVHFAGVLFAPRPERFLPTTNTRWFSNLLDACLAAGVSRVVLISFPHVEGPTSPDSPASGKLDGFPISVHAKTRLEEERLLFGRTDGTKTTPVVLRLGMVYGRGVLMIDAAYWLAKRRLLAVWRKPTWVHLVSKRDFLEATEAAIARADVKGIYHIGDDVPVTLQEFLDSACRAWGVSRPWRLPIWMIYSAALLCELVAAATGKASPLTRDFITIGCVSYCGDTRRTRKELMSSLHHPDLQSGLETL